MVTWHRKTDFVCFDLFSIKCSFTYIIFSWAHGVIDKRVFDHLFLHIVTSPTRLSFSNFFLWLQSYLICAASSLFLDPEISLLFGGTHYLIVISSQCISAHYWNNLKIISGLFCFGIKARHFKQCKHNHNEYGNSKFSLTNIINSLNVLIIKIHRITISCRGTIPIWILIKN